MKIQRAVMLEDDFRGGHLLGEMVITYQELVKLFGRQNQNTDGYKTDAEWLILTPKGHIRIYNYKDGKNYLGKKEGLAIRDINEWHFGGEDIEAFNWIVKYIQDNNK